MSDEKIRNMQATYAIHKLSFLTQPVRQPRQNGDGWRTLLASSSSFSDNKQVRSI